MALSAAAVKTVVQVANALNSKTTMEDGSNSGILIKLICGALACITLLVAAVTSIITSPVEWEDDHLEQFKQNYSYIIPGGEAPNLTGITESEYTQIADNLDISEQRKAVVQTALSLEGRVSYFWGGKSSAIGWDERWGIFKEVTAAGSSTTGTQRPFGLDCAGYVDWVFNNALGYVISHGGGAKSQYSYCTPISWSDAQPGDLLFYDGCAHTGIVVQNDCGKLTVIHCASGYNNVVVTSQSAARKSGFMFAGRPDIYENGSD